jgi:hypothetical protein
MSIPGSIVLVPVPIIVAGQTWNRRTPFPAYPPQPPQRPWPPHQAIPNPERKERMQQARRLLAERRAERPVHY